MAEKKLGGLKSLQETRGAEPGRNADAQNDRKGQKGQAQQRYKSRAMAELHENVSDLYRLGMIDEKTMRRFDRSCLKSSNA